MLFKRRHKLHPIRALRELLWPSAGWKRTLHYFRHRVGRLPGSSYSIAAGLACGAAVSFTPFIGLHLVLSIIFAWALNVSALASAFGTVVGNPWTFPFIWYATYSLGAWILGLNGGERELSMLTVNQIFADPFTILAPVFLPMVIGGIILGSIAWFVTYWISLGLIDSYRRRRKKRRQGMSSEQENTGPENGAAT